MEIKKHSRKEGDFPSIMETQSTERCVGGRAREPLGPLHRVGSGEGGGQGYENP